MQLSTFPFAMAIAPMLKAPATLGTGDILPKLYGCNMTGLAIQSAPEGLPPPSGPLAFVTIALGTQNYTCTSNGNYTAAGAVAELFDISCLSSPGQPDTMADDLYAFWQTVPKVFSTQGIIDLLLPVANPAVLGQHYFITNPKTGQGISPKWDFSAQGSHKGNNDAIVVVERLAGVPAPTGEKDVDWLATGAIAGNLSQQVYRTDTRGGKAPASCDVPGETLAVKYVSKYWFYGGSFLPGSNQKK